MSYEKSYSTSMTSTRKLLLLTHGNEGDHVLVGQMTYSILQYALLGRMSTFRRYWISTRLLLYLGIVLSRSTWLHRILIDHLFSDSHFFTITSIVFSRTHILGLTFFQSSLSRSFIWLIFSLPSSSRWINTFSQFVSSPDSSWQHLRIHIRSEDAIFLE